MGTVRPHRCAKTAHRGSAVLLTLLLGLAQCGPPPPPPPTIALLKLSAAADVNPGQDGAGAPVMVRVYQLAATPGFEKAEFFRLLNGDAAVLGQDLVKRDEYLLAPKAVREDSVPIPDRVQALGVLAAYREFQTKTWRTVIALPPHQTTPVSLSFGGSGISVVPAK